LENQKGKEERKKDGMKITRKFVEVWNEKKRDKLVDNDDTKRDKEKTRENGLFT
jgi:hypothetical protein